MQGAKTTGAGLESVIDHPGLRGAFGAIMDEYARAAEDFCRVLESLPPGSLDWTQSSTDPDTGSVRTLCAHVINAARGYANYVREARILPKSGERIDAQTIRAAREVRDRLAEALRYTEGALEGLYDVDEPTYAAIRFQVRWGPVYDPEMILEHAIVHLLRHRRQLERWPRPNRSS